MTANGPFSFCRHCGHRIASNAVFCPGCGVTMAPGSSPGAPGGAERSPKSFGVAVSLAGVFGVMGIHHFYLGNWRHGLFDLGLFLLAVTLYVSGIVQNDPSLIGAALVVFLIDAVHTLVVMIRLLTGKARDGQGRIVAFPGQM